MVEVGGVEPPSLSNPIKAATCPPQNVADPPFVVAGLVCLLNLLPGTSADRISKAAAFKSFARPSKANPA